MPTIYSEGIFSHMGNVGLVLPLFALAFFLGAYFFFYRGGYDAPQTVEIPFDSIVSPASSHSTFTEVPQLRHGLLLVDLSHRNDFNEGEISSLLARVSDRGHDIEFIGGVPPAGLKREARFAGGKPAAGQQPGGNLTR